MMRKLSRAVGASALGVGLVLAGQPGTAHAATTKCAYHGYDRACVTNYTSTASLQVCDNESDGHGVNGWFTFARDHDYAVGFGDTNGSATGCNTATEGLIYSFVVCEDGEGCSGRVYM